MIINKKLSVLFISLFALGASSHSVTAASLEEIVVTAQKRSENLQDVPISIATISEERLDAMFDGGADIRALAGRVPSLHVEGSSGRTAPRFYMRGLGNVDFDLQASQPVSVIMDGVVMENVLLKGFPLFDIEQVEILRGPQGTLFGRNTPAGIVKFDTRKPTRELEGYAKASYGRYDSTMIQAAVGGGLTNSLSVRVAMQYNGRADWVRNAEPTASFGGFGDDNDDLGDHRDVAIRTHLLFEPNDDFSALLTLQHRDLEGTTTLFRANILDAGSNKLNSRFDRDSVFYDGGRNNPSHVKTTGGSLKMELDFSDLTLTSITGYMRGDSDGLGDIDGGAGAFGLTTCCGVIPFRSETGSIDTDLLQFTQELRLSNDSAERLRWQVGAFYFHDKFSADSTGYGGTGNPSLAAFGGQLALTVQTTDAYALFSQLSYDVNDRFTVTGGARYSSDNKSFVGSRPINNNPFALGGATLAPITENAHDTHISWDISGNYALNDDVNLYARFANGFRGPSIQGRLLFANVASKAQSETINSFEVGMKSELLNNRLRLNGALFYYEVDDQQFTAIGGNGNNSQLINADKGEGYGFELDTEFLATDSLSFTAGLSYNHTEIKDSSLLVTPCGGGCTVLDPINADGKASIDGNPFPQAPEIIFTTTARYAVPYGNGEFYGFTDWSVTGETNFFLYESAEFNNSGNFEGGVRVGYDHHKSNTGVALFVRNITDEENLVGGIDFNNLTGFVNEPRIWGAEVSYDF